MMMYVALIAFIGLVCWMLREQGREQSEKECMEQFYKSEYTHLYPTAD